VGAARRGGAAHLANGGGGRAAGRRGAPALVHALLRLQQHHNLRGVRGSPVLNINTLGSMAPRMAPRPLSCRPATCGALAETLQPWLITLASTALNTATPPHQARAPPHAARACTQRGDAASAAAAAWLARKSSVPASSAPSASGPSGGACSATRTSAASPICARPAPASGGAALRPRPACQRKRHRSERPAGTSRRHRSACRPDLDACALLASHPHPTAEARAP